MTKGTTAVLFGGLVAVGYAAWRSMRQQEQEPQFYVVPASGGGSDVKDSLKAGLIGWGVDTLFSALGGQMQGGSGQGGTPYNGGILGDLFGGGSGTSTSGYQVDRAPTGSGQTGPGGLDFGNYEARYNLPNGYLHRTAQIESAMNPNAKNPNSSASGLFQFIKSTARAYGLSNPFDAAASTDAASRLARDNARQLRGVLGREPTGAELYLAHQQGGAGAARLLRNPNRRAVDVVGRQAVRLNGGDENMTAGEFAGLWINKYNRGLS